jgi:hypothetical protein
MYTCCCRVVFITASFDMREEHEQNQDHTVKHAICCFSVHGCWIPGPVVTGSLSTSRKGTGTQEPCAISGSGMDHNDDNNCKEARLKVFCSIYRGTDPGMIRWPSPAGEK